MFFEIFTLMVLSMAVLWTFALSLLAISRGMALVTVVGVALMFLNMALLALNIADVLR